MSGKVKYSSERQLYSFISTEEEMTPARIFCYPCRIGEVSTTVDELAMILLDASEQSTCECELTVFE